MSLSWNNLPWNMLFDMAISTGTFDHKRQLYHIYFQSASLPLITSWRAFTDTKMSARWQPLLRCLYDHLLNRDKKNPKLKINFPYFHLFKRSTNFITTFRHQSDCVGKKRGFFSAKQFIFILQSPHMKWLTLSCTVSTLYLFAHYPTSEVSRLFLSGSLYTLNNNWRPQRAFV